MPAKKKKTKVNTDELRQKLKLKNFELAKNFQDRFPDAHSYFLERQIQLDKLRDHSAKLISAGALTGTLFLTPPNSINTLPSPKDVISEIKHTGDVYEITGLRKIMTENLKLILPDNVRPLERNEEKYIEVLIQNLTGIKTRATLEGEHLNTTYGYIGTEQHLRRYPGDTVSEHGSIENQKEGIAPGLGAWGYFAQSKTELTEQLIEIEKWYAVVQTLYLPDWGTRQPYLKNWYKYRKVLIINTNNGKAVVASIADSGPAAWTGKHFGGSPEVMDYLGGARYKKGPVIIFFVDDPENRVPLGPVDYNSNSIPGDLLVNS